MNCFGVSCREFQVGQLGQVIEAGVEPRQGVIQRMGRDRDDGPQGRLQTVQGGGEPSRRWCRFVQYPATRYPRSVSVYRCRPDHPLDGSRVIARGTRVRQASPPSAPFGAGPGDGAPRPRPPAARGRYLGPSRGRPAAWRSPAWRTTLRGRPLSGRDRTPGGAWRGGRGRRSRRPSSGSSSTSGSRPLASDRRPGSDRWAEW